LGPLVGLFSLARRLLEELMADGQWYTIEALALVALRRLPPSPLYRMGRAYARKRKQREGGELQRSAILLGEQSTPAMLSAARRLVISTLQHALHLKRPMVERRSGQGRHSEYRWLVPPRMEEHGSQPAADPVCSSAGGDGVGCAGPRPPEASPEDTQENV
jgi:hypothetical protein